MYPGKYPHRVTVMLPTVTTDEIGNKVTTLAETGKAWAGVYPLSGREYFAAAQDQGSVTHKIKLRPPSFAITRECEITLKERTFTIDAILDPGRGAEVVIMAVEKV